MWLKKFPVDLVDPEMTTLHELKVQAAFTFSSICDFTIKYLPSSIFGKLLQEIVVVDVDGCVGDVFFGDEEGGTAKLFEDILKLRMHFFFSKKQH